MDIAFDYVFEFSYSVVFIGIEFSIGYVSEVVIVGCICLKVLYMLFLKTSRSLCQIP